MSDVVVRILGMHFFQSRIHTHTHRVVSLRVCFRGKNVPQAHPSAGASRRKFVLVTMLRCGDACQDLPGLKPAKARVKRKIQKHVPERSGLSARF